MNINEFNSVRNRFYTAKENLRLALIEAKDSRAAYDTAINTWNDTIEKEKEIINKFDVFASIPFNIAEASPTKVTIPIAEVMQQTPVKTPYVNPTRLSETEREFFDQDLKPFIQRNGIKRTAKTIDVNEGAVNQWFHGGYPSKENFKKLMELYKKPGFVRLHAPHLNDQEKHIWKKDMAPFIFKKPVAELSRETGIHKSTLATWSNDYGRFPCRQHFETLATYIKKQYQSFNHP